jgi:hypothetical protein
VSNTDTNTKPKSKTVEVFGVRVKLDTGVWSVYKRQDEAMSPRRFFLFGGANDQVNKSSRGAAVFFQKETTAKEQAAFLNRVQGLGDEAAQTYVKPGKAGATKDVKAAVALDAKIAKIAAEKKAPAEKKPLPLTSPAKRGPGRPRGSKNKPVAEDHAIEEVVIDGGAPIKVTRVAAPKGAKAPYILKDGKVVRHAATWVEAQKLLTAEPSPASVYDSTDRVVASTKDGVNIETFAVEAMVADAEAHANSANSDAS